MNGCELLLDKIRDDRTWTFYIEVILMGFLSLFAFKGLDKWDVVRVGFSIIAILTLNTLSIVRIIYKMGCQDVSFGTPGLEGDTLKDEIQGSSSSPTTEGERKDKVEKSVDHQAETN